ncbi:MAG: cob(I)yrinic acid a,c-diamide adenosyltransferase [Eubacteriales bacterium]
MEKGYIQIYTGDGKGKTTAAFGLALRCAGRGNHVLIVQFMKKMDTGELKAIEPIENIEVLRVCQTVRFSFEWTKEEKAQERENALQMLKTLQSRMTKDIDLLVLDEALGAISAGVLTEEELLGLIDKKPEHVEIVLTGRNCPDGLRKRADLITEMRPEKHYMTCGVKARKGIEF